VGKPVAVLSNNDGCIVALSPEAKVLGFKGGEVFFKTDKKLEKAGVAVFSSNYSLYGDISRRVMMTMETLVPEIFQYSIDEAFVPLSESEAVKAVEIGWELHDRVKRWVGVPVRVGLGETRTLAKLANHWAKKKSRVYLLTLGSSELENILEQTKVSDIWGIGRQHGKKLENLGIKTARSLRDMDLPLAKKVLTVMGQKTVLELRGIQCFVDDLNPLPRKTLVSSRSFGQKITKFEDLSEALATHATRAAERLRREGLLSSCLSVFIETGRYIDQPFHTGATVGLADPTNLTIDLIKAARQALEHCFKPGYPYLKAGVILYELIKTDSIESNLLTPLVPKEETPLKLMSAIDLINGKYGRNVIKFSAQGNSKPAWGMRQKRLSGVSTTSWEDLPTVKA
jgi:DNA polymerase V